MATINLGRVGFVQKGTYSSSTEYKVNDIVTNLEGVYACIQPNIGQPLSNIEYWVNWSSTTASGVSNLPSGNITSVTVQDAINELDIKKPTGFKNYIINGGFDVWQRGASFTTTGYTADRWYSSISNATITRSTNGNNIVTTSNGVGYGNHFQSIEFLSAKKLLGKVVTLSFSLLSTTGVSGNIIASIKYNTISDSISNSWTVIAATNKTLNAGENIVGVVTCTIPVDAKGILIAFEQSIEDDVGKEWGVSNVQLEEGSVATPFEQRPYGLELSLCQRYYEAGRFFNVSGYCTTGANVGSSVFFKVNKRTIPTVSVFNVNTAGGLSSTPAQEDVQTDSFLSYRTTIGTSGPAQYTENWYASAEL